MHSSPGDARISGIGPYRWRGRTLRDIGRTPAGLRWLDMLREGDWILERPDLRRALWAFLEDPAVMDRLRKAYGI